MQSNSKTQILRRRHMPERSCIACREKAAKGELIRLVCSDSGVEIDSRGKKVSRGAYLCPIRECWEVGLKGNRLEYALRTKLTLENREMLVEYGKSLPEKEETQR